MMAGNPNWWTMSNGMQHPQQPSHHHHHHLSSTSTNYLSPPPLFGSSSSSLSSTSLSDSESNQEYPRSWSQLLLGGLASDNHQHGHQYYNRLENWEDHHHHGCLNNPSSLSFPINDINVKQEVIAQNSCQLYGQYVSHEENHHQQEASNSMSRVSWPIVHHEINLVSSPTSCVTSSTTLSTTTTNNNLLNFSSSKANRRSHQQRLDHHSYESNNSSNGGLAKRPRVQHSSVQPALKVRKEKLGDRITALHQLVSPFGKTDTASVLSEAIGYIRFLLGQIEALSSPYMSNASKNMPYQHHEAQNGHNDLKSRGLCLVPVSCTQHVGSDNGADCWSPTLGGGF